MDKNIYKVLSDIQQKLEVPKERENEFGGFNFRSAEDILEEAKKLLPEGYVILLQDDIETVGKKIVRKDEKIIERDEKYLKATAILTDGNDKIETSAFAREIKNKKKMDSAQMTGATSSYARKFALRGLLGLDDSNDADALTSNSGSKQSNNRKRSNTNQSSNKKPCPNCKNGYYDPSSFDQCYNCNQK